MTDWSTLLKRSMVSAAAAASVASSLALAATAKVRGLSAVQPVNATSHWLHGEAAADVRTADIAHTGVGYATHHAATLFWATIFEAWIGRRRPVAAVAVMRDAAIMSAVAAGVDYIATPKRFTPGWEFVLPKRSMAFVYAAMAVGLGLGVLGQDWREVRA